MSMPAYVFVGLLIITSVSTYAKFKQRAWLSFTTLLFVCGVVIFLLGSAMSQSVGHVNDSYAAATKQGLTITVDEWRLTPIAMVPCRIELILEGTGKSAYLALPDSGKKASQDTITALCDLLKD